MKIKRSGQKGIALLLALGIMSLLLVLALAFATNAAVARKSAANNSARSQARYFGKSAINQIVMNIMAYKHDNPSVTDFSSLVSKSPAGKNGNVIDGIRAGVTPNLLNVKIGNVLYSPDAARQPQWEMIHEENTGTGAPNENSAIIGRYAYMLIPKAGDMSLSEALRGYANPAFTPAANYPASWTKRYGIDMKELNLGVKITDSAFLTRASSQFVGENHASDPEVLKDDYADFDSFFTDPFFSTYPAAKDWFRKWFAIGGRTEAESFPYDPLAGPSSTKISDSATYYHRFNLARSDWNTGLGTTANSSSAVERLLGLLPGDPVPEFKTDDTVTPANMRLQFLRMIGDTPGAYPNRETRRKQIAANLLDYCDNDDIPTSDSNDWWTTPPSYTGNERKPAINEIAVLVAAVAERTDVDDGSGGKVANVTCNVSLNEAALEVFNLYGNSSDPLPGMEVRIEGMVYVTVSVGGTAIVNNEAIPLSPPQFAAVPAGGLAPRYGYITLIPNPLPSINRTRTNITNPDVGDNCKVQVTVNQVDISKIYLGMGGVKVDFTKSLTASQVSMVMDKVIAVDTTENAYLAVDFSVDDPRDNLYQGAGTYENWKFMTGSPFTTAPIPINYGNDATIGRQNGNCNPLGAGDAEPFNGDGTVSTAYIANDRMLSPLELGVIHRAAKWESINLKAAGGGFSFPNFYNPNFGIDNVGTFYSDGDGGILDQIKMTSKTYDAAKVNLNSREDTIEGRQVFEALVSGVTVLNSEAKDATLGTPLSASAVTKVGTVMAAIPAATQFLNRAELLEYSNGGNYTSAYGDVALTGTTDVTKEALFAKTVCLMTTKSQPAPTLQFLLVAQSIKDVGGNITVARSPSDGSAARTKVVETGKFDYETVGSETLYYDDIGGEVKMLITVAPDPVTSKYKVIRTEFVE